MISAGTVDPNAGTNSGIGTVNMPSPASSASGISGPDMSMAGGIGSIGSSIGQMASGIASYVIGKRILNTQTEMVKDGLDHQATMSGHDRDMKMDALKGQEAKIKVQVEGNKEYLAAVRERRKAEGELACAEAQEHEGALTEKAGKTNTKALDNLFQNYSYGEPLKA
jgi:hypothetical protein